MILRQVRERLREFKNNYLEPAGRNFENARQRKSWKETIRRSDNGPFVEKDSEPVLDYPIRQALPHRVSDLVTWRVAQSQGDSEQFRSSLHFQVGQHSRTRA